jgi:hypothetical protein
MQGFKWGFPRCLWGPLGRSPTDANSTQPKIVVVEIAGKDGPIDILEFT